MDTGIERQTHHLGIWIWLASGAVLVTILLRRFRGGNRLKEGFLNEKGERIKEITTDVRLSKFIRSLELSQQGHHLASGEPYLVRSGESIELVLSQPSHIQEFYKQDAKHHQKPKNFNLGELFGRLAGDAVGTKYGDNWRKIRKHFDPVFSFHSIVESKTKFDVEIQQWIKGLAAGNDSEINPGTAFKYLTFRLLAVHLYGDAFDDRIYWRMLELNEMHETVIQSLLTAKWPDSKIYNLLPTANNRKMSSYLSQWKEFNRMIIEHVRGGGWVCPAEVIYRGVEPSKEMTESEFLATLDEILFTNVDVSSKVLSTIFTNLANNSSIQTALRAEIKSKRAELGEAKYLARPDTLLNRVIMESMRISPAFWFSMPESTAEDKTIGGYLIPAKTSVIIDTRCLNNNSCTFGGDSGEFNPDRFLNIQSENLLCGFMRFGVGAASGRCLGKNAADVLFKMTTVCVVEKFRLLQSELGEKGERGGAMNIRLSRL